MKANHNINCVPISSKWLFTICRPIGWFSAKVIQWKRKTTPQFIILRPGVVAAVVVRFAAQEAGEVVDSLVDGFDVLLVGE